MFTVTNQCFLSKPHIVNESGKLSFIDFRNFLINKTEERLDYVTKNIDRYKLDCPADAVYTIGKLKKERAFLTKKKKNYIERIQNLFKTYDALKKGESSKPDTTEKSIFECKFIINLLNSSLKVYTRI